MRKSLRLMGMPLGVAALGVCLAGWVMSEGTASTLFAISAIILLCALAVSMGDLFARTSGEPQSSQGGARQEGLLAGSPIGASGGDAEYLAQVMLQAVSEGVMVLEPNGSIVSVNASALCNLGYESKEDLAGRNVHELIHHSFPDGVAFERDDCPLYTAVVQGRENMQSLVMLWRRDGSHFLASAHCRPIVEDDRVRGAVFVFLDVTELHAQEAIRQTAFAASSDAYIIFSDELEVEDVNPAALRLFKVQSPANFSLQAQPLLFPELQPDGTATQALIHSVMLEVHEKGAARLAEIVVRDSEGVELPCTISLVRIDLGGRSVIFANIHDLRSIRQAEESISRERQHQQMLLDTNPLGVVVVTDDNVCWANPRSAELVNMRVGGRTLPAYVSQLDYRIVQEALERNGIVRDYAIQMYGPHGEIRDIYLTALSTEFQGAPAVVVWMMDISELKVTEKALTEARDAAEAATRAKSDFLAHMSHEIRTPMNAIIGMGYLCLQTKLSPKQRDYLNKIQDAAHSLMTIINDILDFSQVDEEGLSLEKAPFLLDGLLETVSSTLSPLAEKKNLEFLVRINPALPNHLEGDSLRLSQVLLVLGNNAIKFTEAGEIMMSVDCVREDEDSVVVRFSVSDTGIGMNEQELEKLFQPFTQADDSSTRRFGGTGLGLAISKKIVALLGGRIWVESRPREGSTFRFTVRLEKEKGVAATMPEDRFQSLEAMVVDDNPAACVVLAEQVNALGFHVTSASSGREALELLERGAKENRYWSLLLLDWRMPELDGLETAHLVWSSFQCESGPIMLLVTGTGAEPARSTLEATGIRACLSKPIALHVLRETVDRLMEEGLTPPDRSGGGLSTIRGAMVLLVEDNEINQEIARSLLESAGMVVDVACNGEEAVARVTQGKAGAYQLVFMDIQMPVMDGLEAARRIRAFGVSPDQLPIVAMTAHAGASDREKSLEAGMNDHITKPLDPQELVVALTTWIQPFVCAGKSELDIIPAALSLALTDDVAQSESTRWAACDASPQAEAEFPGLSQKAGLESVGGNRALYAKLLRKFQASCRDSDTDIENALLNNDGELAVRVAHTVKGVAASLGLMVLSRVASDVERGLREAMSVLPSMSGLTLQEKASSRTTLLQSPLLPAFSDTLRQTLAAVDAYLHVAGVALPEHEGLPVSCAVPPLVVTAAQRREAVDLAGALGVALEADWGAVMNAMERLKALLTGSVYVSSLQELSVAVENFDIPQARRAIQSMTRELAAAS